MPFAALLIETVQEQPASHPEAESVKVARDSPKEGRTMDVGELGVRCGR